MADVVLEKVHMVNDVVDSADVAYKRFEFFGPDKSLGECVQYRVRYTLRLDSGQYRLDERKALDGNGEIC